MEGESLNSLNHLEKQVIFYSLLQFFFPVVEDFCRAIHEDLKHEVYLGSSLSNSCTQKCHVVLLDLMDT